MSEAAISDFRLTSPATYARPALSAIRRHLSRFTAGSSTRSVIAWLLADGIVVHCAMIAALFARLLWLLQGEASPPAAHIAELTRCYLERMLPLSLIFPFLFLVSRCYSGPTCRDWTRSTVSLLRASFVAAVLYSAACALGGRLGTLDVSTGALFLGLTLSGTLASRWVRSLAASPHSTESLPAYVRGVRSEEGPVLVVGGAGYIGSILVRRLIASGRKVRVLDSLAYGNSALRGLFGHPSMELQAGDCRNLKSVVSAVDGVDTVIHLAAIVGDPACEEEREAALETNYAATRMLIEVAKGAKVRRLVFASTCSVYGASDELVEETSQPNPISLYAQTKVQSEQALLEAKSDLFHPTILRLATVFGHSYRPRFDLVVNLLVAKARQEGVITIYNGQQWRPFVHVRDAAECMAMILDMPTSIVSGQIFNLGDSRLNYTLSQLADSIRKVFPETRVEHVDNNDRRNYRVSFDKIHRLVGFEASRTLDDGIRELAEAFDSRLVEDYKLALYNNQCFLRNTGSVRNPNEVDTYVMAAFSRHFQALAQTNFR